MTISYYLLYIVLWLCTCLLSGWMTIYWVIFPIEKLRNEVSRLKVELQKYHIAVIDAYTKQSLDLCSIHFNINRIANDIETIDLSLDKKFPESTIPKSRKVIVEPSEVAEK